MPAIKLPRFGTGPDAPSLRQRAAALRATVKRLKRTDERPEPTRVVTERDAPVDWSDPPEGFMAYPALNPQGFITIELGLPREAERLYRIARREMDRVTAADEYGGALSTEEVVRRRGALRLDALHEAAFGRRPSSSTPPPVASVSEASKPSAVARLADYVARERNRIDALPDDFDADEREALIDTLAMTEYELCDRPALTPADLAIKMRVVARHIEGHLPLAEHRYFETRTWLGLRADIERIARGTPISGTYRELGEGTDEATRAYPIFCDESGAGHIDPIFAAIERARFVSRQVNAPHPGDRVGATREEADVAEAECSRLCTEEDRVFLDVFKIRPTTREGLFALIDYARERADFAEMLAERDGKLFDQMLSAIRDGAAMTLDGVWEVAAPDQVFDLLAQFRAIQAEGDASPLNGARYGTPEAKAREAEIDALSEREVSVWRTLFARTPATPAGLLALIRFAGEHYDAFAGIDDEPDVFRVIGDGLSSLMGAAVQAASEPVSCEAARIGHLLEDTSAEIERLDGVDDAACDLACNKLYALHDAISLTRARSFSGALAQVCILPFEAHAAQHGGTADIRKTAEENVSRLSYSLAAFLRKRGGLLADTALQRASMPAALDRLAILDRTEA